MNLENLNFEAILELYKAAGDEVFIGATHEKKPMILSRISATSGPEPTHEKITEFKFESIAKAASGKPMFIKTFSRPEASDYTGTYVCQALGCHVLIRRRPGDYQNGICGRCKKEYRERFNDQFNNALKND